MFHFSNSVYIHIHKSHPLSLYIVVHSFPLFVSLRLYVMFLRSSSPSLPNDGFIYVYAYIYTYFSF